MGVDMSFDGLQWLGGPFPDTEEVTSSNLVTPTTTSQVTPPTCDVACFCDSHLDDLLRYGHIEQSTRRAYGYLMRHVRDFFAGRGISDITHRDLSAFVAFLQGRGLAPGTVRKTYNMLCMCVKRARAEGLTECDVSLVLRAPKNRCPPPNPLTRDSTERLLSCLSTLERTPCVIAAYVALLTGMRRGEVCGLQWRDVSFTTSTISVTRSIGIRSGGTYVKPPKTGVSRDVPMVGELARMLKARRYLMMDECDDRGIEFRPTHYVIGNARGEYLSPYRVTRWWNEHSREWGLVGTQGRVPTFHDLRHTFATVAVRELDLKTTQSIMGHASAEMTMRYADTELGQVRDASNMLGSAFSMGN